MSLHLCLKIRRKREAKESQKADVTRVVENEDTNYIVESDDEQYESDLAYLYGVLDKVF